MKLRLTCRAVVFLIFISGIVQQAKAQAGIGIPYTFSTSTPALTPPGGATFTSIWTTAKTNFTSNVLGSASTGLTTYPGFTFGGVLYSSFFVSSAGWLGLTNLPAGSAPPWGSSTNGINLNNLSGSANGPVIAPLWDSLSVATAYYSWNAATNPNELWIRMTGIKWNLDNASSSMIVYFRLKVATQSIDFVYTNLAYTPSATASASIGIAGPCTGDYYSVKPSPFSGVDSTVENNTINTRPQNINFTFTPRLQANDDCANAISLGTVSAICTNATYATVHTSASAAAVAGAMSCSTDTNDAWFTVTKPLGSTSIDITTSAPTCAGALTGTTVEVYSGTCGSGTLVSLGCSSTNGASPFGKVSLTGFSACSSQTFYIRVTGDGNTSGKFNICCTNPSPTGFICSNATPVCTPLPFNVSGLTTQGYGNDYSSNVLCLSENMTGEDYIFSYTPASTQCVNVSIDGTGTNTFPGLFITDGCPSDTINSHCSAFAVSTTSSSTGDTISNVTLVGGHTYYIIVDNDSVLSGGTTHIPFNFHISQSVTAAPANDACSSATFLNSGNPIPSNATCASTLSAQYTTECATPSPVAGYYAPNCGGFSPTLSNDVWFKFTSAYSGTITINAQQGSTNPAQNLGMAVYTGSCGAFIGSASLLGCSADSLPAVFMPSLTVTVASATVYYIRIWTAGGFDPGTFKLCFAASCDPANDLIINATYLTLSTPVQGDNTCATGIGEMSTPINCKDDGSQNSVWYKLVMPASGQVTVRISQGTMLDAGVAAFYFASGVNNAASTFTRLACNDDLIGATGCNVCGMTGDNDAAITFTHAVGDTIYVAVGSSFGTGSFWITAISGPCSGTFPPLYRRDCDNPEIICSTGSYFLPNGGIGSNGNICDFSNFVCSGGPSRTEVGAVWLQFTVAPASPSSGLGFTITPNDNIANYNFYLWDITSTGDFCNQVHSGTITPTRCNTTSNTGNTGCRNPSTTVYADLPPAAQGRTYMLYIENQTSANDDEGAPGTNTGFSINWDIYVGGVNVGTTQLLGTSSSSTWTGTVVDTAYGNISNWTGVGTCPANIPTCAIDVYISSASKQCWATNSGVFYAKNLTINSGGTLKLDAGSQLHICGDFINNGSLIADPTSTIIFEGSSTQNMTGSFSGANAVGNLTVTKPSSSSVKLNTNLDITGSFTTSNINSIFNVNGKYIKVAKDFSNYQTTITYVDTVGTSTLEFNGSGPQIFTNLNNSSDTIRLKRVFMNQSPASTVTLTGTKSTMNIDTSLTLTSGVIVTSGLLEVNVKNNTSACVNAGNNNSYVQGRLRRKVAGPPSIVLPLSIDFPVGDAAHGYNRANVYYRASTIAPSLMMFFSPWVGTPPNGPVSNECAVANYNQNQMLNNGYWTLCKGGSAGTGFNGQYMRISAYNNGYSNATGAGWSIAKTLDTLHDIYDSSNWVLAPSWGKCFTGSTLANTQRDSINFPTSTTNFNMHFATVQSTLPLPIDLLSFTADPEKEGVMCAWETASETNNDYFVVERSQDSKDFIFVGRVPGHGAGSSTQALTYKLLDKNPPCVATLYYRLKQVDLDGKFTYSDVVAVNCNNKDAVSIYPNPANTEVNINFYQPFDGTVTVKILDILGKEVSESVHTVEKGYNAVRLKIDDLPLGVYNLKIINNGDEGSSRSKLSRFVKY